ncbi:MAG: hypothetical protein R3F62_16505 [Planctomycetota bacterium]
MTKLHALTLIALMITSAAFADPTPGISSAQTSQLEEAAAHARDLELRDAIDDALHLAGGEARRVRFTFEGDQGALEVRGAVLAWDTLKVERYRVADLAEAMLLGEQDRDDPSEPHTLELRGRDVLVLSGPAAQDAATVRELRSLCWPKSAQKRVDGFYRKAGEDDQWMRISREALAASPWLAGHPSLEPTLMQQLAALSPNATLTSEGTLLRLDLGGDGIMTLDRADAFTAVGMHTSADAERAILAFRDAVLGDAPAPAAGPGAPAAGGLVDGLAGSAPASPWRSNRAAR